MGYALDPSDTSRSQPPKSHHEVLERLSKAHELIIPALAEFIISPDGVDASAILLAALTGEASGTDRSVTFVVTSRYRAESLRVLFRIPFSSSGATSAVLNADGYRPVCKGCFGRVFQTPMTTGPLFKKQLGEHGKIVWTEYSSQERQNLLQSLTGSDLDARVPPTLRSAFAAISRKLDELRGKGAFDDMAKVLGEARTDLMWDDAGLSISAHITRRDKLLAVAHIYGLTPCGREIDCGEGPKIFSSDWDFAQAFGGRQKEPDIDYFQPCWWCRGSGLMGQRPWSLLCEVAFIIKLLWMLVKHRLEKGHWTTPGEEGRI